MARYFSWLDRFLADEGIRRLTGLERSRTLRYATTGVRCSTRYSLRGLLGGSCHLASALQPRWRTYYVSTEVLDAWIRGTGYALRVMASDVRKDSLFPEYSLDLADIFWQVLRIRKICGGVPQFNHQRIAPRQSP